MCKKTLSSELKLKIKRVFSTSYFEEKDERKEMVGVIILNKERINFLFDYLTILSIPRLRGFGR
jgi:hypothetical protein